MWNDIGTAVVLFCIFAVVMAVSFRLALTPAIEALIDLRETFVLPHRSSDDGRDVKRFGRKFRSCGKR